MVRCKLCGWSGEDDLESHLLESHFLSYPEYCERVIGNKSSHSCWKCGSPRYPLSLWIDLFLPCKQCEDPRLNDEVRIEILRKIHDYLVYVAKNKFVQYFLSLQDRSCILGGSFSEAVTPLLTIKRENKIRIDKESIISVRSIPGTPFEISDRNISNLQITTKDYVRVEKERTRYLIFIGQKLFILYPLEEIPYDSKHHSRHSILNPGSKRNTKKLKLSSGKCYKFWSPNNDSQVRMLFLLTDSEDNQVYLSEIPDQYKEVIKQVILGTRELRDSIFEVYLEIVGFVKTVSDQVFLLNSFDLPGKKDLAFMFTWEQEQQNQQEEENVIKLSIL